MKIYIKTKKFILDSRLSYSKLIQILIQKYGIKVSKSSISYYKRTQKRLKEPRSQSIRENEFEWLKGLFLADGCKFKGKNYEYVIKFALDQRRDIKIINKLTGIFDKLQVHCTRSSQGKASIFRVFNKTLFNNLPESNIFYKPKNNLAFLSGLIDGDGCKHGRGAILVQSKNKVTMNYLVKELNITKYSKFVQTNFGRFRIIQYYIPKSICSTITKENLSEKLS